MIVLFQRVVFFVKDCRCVYIINTSDSKCPKGIPVAKENTKDSQPAFCLKNTPKLAAVQNVYSI